MGLKWIKILTHIHTLNSDGKDTLEAMAEAAKKHNIDAICLTDHNTMAGYENFDKVYEVNGVKIIKGIEYTTFYGHIIAIDAPYYRWENINKKSLNELVDYVHKNDGIIGIAHPRQLGDPVSTGATFEFENVDFKNIDFIETWHRVINESNEWERNEKFWLDKINAVGKITCLYGGDFHAKENFDKSSAVNWLLIDENKEFLEAVKEGIRCGRLIMSKGVCFDMTLENNNEIYNIGDTALLSEKEQYRVTIKPCELVKDISMKVCIVSNDGILAEAKYDEKCNIQFKLYGDKRVKWIRAKIIDYRSNDTIAITNPIYFKTRKEVD
ncbi:CehA/McbA family metallohydrolase [Clostridium hydrogenum]|uniref:CehA/McbA family metallohydrolase n=1 Tax=Clostridium hydrogenum TaxID=2855764 RepID=UPI001F2B1215|nr:CehA/McbA family metallohydrolase [Clostridium hydrogenum]